jgi:hypothetical protein
MKGNSFDDTVEFLENLHPPLTDGERLVWSAMFAVGFLKEDSKEELTEEERDEENEYPGRRPAFGGVQHATNAILGLRRCRVLIDDVLGSPYSKFTKQIVEDNFEED